MTENNIVVLGKGEVTPQSLLLGILENIEDVKHLSVVVTYKPVEDEDYGSITVGWSVQRTSDRVLARDILTMSINESLEYS